MTGDTDQLDHRRIAQLEAAVAELADQEEAARTAAADARDALHDAIAEARDAGSTVSALARISGINRVTLQQRLGPRQR